LNKKADSVIHFDERGLAYHALGYAAASGKIPVLVCTSGTAVANFFPAIIESSKKKLPLIVLTADRPPELRKTGADQTIDQPAIYGNYVRWFNDMPCPTTDINPEFILTTIDQAVYQSKGHYPGPVHINCMFREPLAPIKENRNFKNYLRSISRWQKNNKPYTKYDEPKLHIVKNDYESLANYMGQIKNGIIAVGKLKSEKEQKAVINLANKMQWPVFADITSGLRFGTFNNQIIYNYDQILLSEKFCQKFPLDGLLHLGGRMSSKRFYQFIQSKNPPRYITVLNHSLRNDPLHKVSHRIQADISDFCQSMTHVLNGNSSDAKINVLRDLSRQVDTTMKSTFVNNKGLNEPIVARLVSKHIKNNNGLFLASSMPIREMDMFAGHEKKNIIIGSNRGASGIDGTIASAIGFAKGINKPLTLLIGDLAFLHDMNSLALLKQCSKSLTMVVLNNNGGGIFSFLSINEFPEIFEKYFGTPHKLNFKSIAKMFELNYSAPTSVKKFILAYTSAQNKRQSTIIEIKTNRKQNLKYHQTIQKKIKTDIEKRLMFQNVN